MTRETKDVRPSETPGQSGPGRDLDAGLVLAVGDHADTLQETIELEPKAFPGMNVADLAEAYHSLPAAVAEDPHRTTESSRAAVDAAPRASWNDTRVEFSRDQQVEQLFDLQAARTPDAVALRHEGRSLSYRELQRRSNQLAHQLRAYGIGPDQLVAICTDRSPDMVVGLLGILKSGAAYVPLDPYYPAERLAFMLEDAKVSAIVTQQQWMARLPRLGAPIVRFDADREQLLAQSVETPATQAGGENLAYVIYTSGSTGAPKGVAVRRCALVNLLHAMRRNLQFGPSDTLLAITTISFDIAGLEMYLPMLSGGRIVLATRADTVEAARLARLLESESVTFLQGTPATWRMLLESSWAGKRDLCMLCGGEAMTRDLANKLLARGDRLWNLYGPTETTIWSTMCRVLPGDEPISIGRPIDNTQIHILDAELRPVPVGSVGELYIGGVGLARGYLHRPELTAEKFIASPFAAAGRESTNHADAGSPTTESDTLIYRTGDLARYLPDGRIECLGRVDHQVKIRGFRIELPEIEARLGAHPQVSQAAVVALDSGQDDKYLAGYWTADLHAPGPPPTHESLRRFLAETLPEHMVPSVWTRLDAMPLTPNGKIDRRALPAPDRKARVPDAGYVAPRTDIERELVEIWQDLLEVRPIGVQDDFFAIGGHSLAAARLVARIDAIMGHAIPLATLLSAPTVESLARVLAGETQARSGVLVRFSETGNQTPLFLVAGVGGHVLIFRELADLLSEDRPVYALQGIGLDGREEPLVRVEAIADRYIQELIAVRPRGPWIVAGWSMGGVIAYEMACQMRERGISADRLVIIDAYAPWAVGTRERLRIHLASFRRRPWRSKLAYFGQRLTHRFEVARRRMGIDAVEEVDGRMAELIRASSLAQFEALRTYQPRPYPGDVTLLRAQQTDEIRDPRSNDPTLGWSSLVHGRVHVVPIPGSHTAIFVGNHLHSLAATLRACLGAEHANAPDRSQLAAAS